MIITVFADQTLHHSLTHSPRVCPGDDVNTDTSGPEADDCIEDTPGDTGAVHTEAAHTKEAVEDQILPEAGTEVTSIQSVGQEAEAQGRPLTLVLRLDLCLTQWN